MTKLKRTLLATLAVATLAVPAAEAAPTTVGLRIEGPNTTLFEGVVTTDVRTFRFTDDPTEHTCDGTSANGGPSATPVPTSGAAVMAAGLDLRGRWFDGFGASFSSINGESTAYDGATNRYLVEYHNEAVAGYGVCGQPIAGGDRVLLAYGTGSEPLLQLSGPAKAHPDEAVTLKVTDAAGAPVAGASVGGATTDTDGTATVIPPTRGDNDFKAAKAGAIRSNRHRVCVTDEADGLCSSPLHGPAAPVATTSRILPVQPLARLSSVRDGQRFPRGGGPAFLRGTVTETRAGTDRVRLRLTRTSPRRACFTLDPVAERQRRLARCGAKRGQWFEVSRTASFEYQMPFTTPSGRWVLDVQVRDRAGRVSKLARGTTRVVFTVR